MFGNAPHHGQRSVDRNVAAAPGDDYLRAAGQGRLQGFDPHHGHKSLSPTDHLFVERWRWRERFDRALTERSGQESGSISLSMAASLKCQSFSRASSRTISTAHCKWGRPPACPAVPMIAGIPARSVSRRIKPRFRLTPWRGPRGFPEPR